MEAMNPHGADRLRDLILEMHRADNEERTSGIAIGRDRSSRYRGLSRSTAATLAVDERNARQLREILRVHGWPKQSVVGADAAATFAFLVAFHAPVDVVRTALPALRAAIAQGEASPVSLAEVEDRLAVAERRPQRYGTQWNSKPFRGHQPYAIADVNSVDERRRELGLDTIAEHRRVIEASFGSTSLLAIAKTVLGVVRFRVARLVRGRGRQ